MGINKDIFRDQIQILQGEIIINDVGYRRDKKLTPSYTSRLFHDTKGNLGFTERF